MSSIVEQGVSARADDLGELALLWRQLRVEKQAGHADHGVHRRPDLVAHGGEEGALRLCCRLRLLARPLELADVTRLVDRRRGERRKGLCRLRVVSRVEVGFERVERQHADQPIADEQRDRQPPLDASPAVDVLVEVLEPRRDVRDDDRLEPRDHLAGRIVGPPPVEALSEQFVEVRKAIAADDHHLVALQLLDAGSSIGHYLAQLRENQIEDFGHFERAAERLGRGLERLGLLASGALGFEQPGVLDRHCGLGGECRGELRQLFGVEVGFELVDADDADHAVADHHGDTEPPANASTAV
jgi:hypothetical protein